MNLRSVFLGALGALAVVSLAPRAVADDAPEAPKHVIVPPKLVTFVQADFPPSEVARGKGATVVLQIAIDAAGRVAGVAVVESAVCFLTSFSVIVKA